MRGELLRMLMARREAEPVETADIAFDVLATAEQLTYSFDAYPSASFSVEWGDGTTSTVPASQSTQSHTYSEAGTYRIRIADTTGLFTGTSRWFKPGANAASPSAAQQAAAAMIRRVYSFNHRTSYYVQYQFSHCVNMTGLELLPTATTIRENCFRNCSSWRPSSMPNTVSTLSGGAFRGCASLDWTQLSTALTSIGSSVFTDCTSLALTSLPSGLLSIGTSAFSNCTSLALTVLPSQLTELGATCFTKAKVDFREIPASVTTIGARFLGQCWTQQEGAQVSIKLLGTPTSINADAFTYSYIGNLYVPWHVGEVAGAPWGAAAATIHYNS